MRKLHLIFGLIMVVIFLLTGQYMVFRLHGMLGMPDTARMLYRSRHIYLLLGALVNLSLGLYLSISQVHWRMMVQRLGSLLIILSPLLFLAGFFRDTTRGDLDVPLSKWGAVSILGGSIFHLIAAARQ
jgi:hypothetical protein